MKNTENDTKKIELDIVHCWDDIVRFIEFTPNTEIRICDGGYENDIGYAIRTNIDPNKVKLILYKDISYTDFDVIAQGEFSKIIWNTYFFQFKNCVMRPI